MREKLFFGILVVLTTAFSSKSLASEGYIAIDDKYDLVETTPSEFPDKTVILFKDGPHVGAQRTVETKFVYSKERSEGKFKVGTDVYIFYKDTIGRYNIIGFSSLHDALVQATEGDVSQRIAFSLDQLLPVEGSFGGVAVGQEIFAAYQQDKNSKTEILKYKVVSYTSSELIGQSEKGVLGIKLSKVFKFEGCSKSHFLCVGQDYYSSKFNTYLKLKAYNDDGDTYEVSEEPKLQIQEFVETVDSLASTQAGACTSDICIGESYLNALNNYSEVKVEAISNDHKIYVSNKARPSEISEFNARPFDLVKASEKQTSLNGINLGQKVILINKEQRKVYPSKLLGISRDQHPIVILNNKISEYSGDMARGEGCDTPKKKCVGQRYFVNDNGSLGRILGIQNDGRFVVEYVSQTSEIFWWDIDAKDLRRGGCPGGICDEKSFGYK